MLIVTHPTVLRIEGPSKALLEKHLQYTDLSADWEYRKHVKAARWKMPRMGEAEFYEETQRLKSLRHKSLLFEDEAGLWTYSGLASKLARLLNEQVEIKVKYPSPALIPWETVPKKVMRPYQEKIVSELLTKRHGGVEVSTGLGKSFCILQLLKSLGLKAVVMAPLKNIAYQLLLELTAAFGKKNVGQFFDSKKDFTKLFTVAVSNSLAQVVEDSPVWNALSKAEVFIADESHMCPAATLAKVCLGLHKNAPYRFFFSATQLRNDGKDLLLDAITGDIVYRMDLREGVDQGYLAKPVVKMIDLETSATLNTDDAQKMTRTHLFFSKKVNEVAGYITNLSVSELNRQVLILVDEISQFTHLLPHFKYEAKFAHGGVTKENKDKLPKEYHESDVQKLVADFNAGKFPILVGTDCISLGVDLLSPGVTINLQGGKSEISVRQGAIGRSIRAPLRVDFPDHPYWPWGEKKTDCLIFDFCVNWSGWEEDDRRDRLIVAKHAQVRKRIYEETYGPVVEERF